MCYIKELVQILSFLNKMIHNMQEKRRLSIKTEIKPENIKLDNPIQPNSENFAQLRLCTLMIDKSMLLK